MQIYNSLSHKKEEFVPHEQGKVSMYTCGPTVYHYAHIGNLRSYIMEDILEKYLRFSGLDVKRVMNITDVGHLTSDGDTGDDKMLKGAKREHKTVMEIAKFYTDAFFDDCKKLNIKTPDVVVPATTYIDEFIRVISVLMEKGYAYEAGGNIYFDTSKLDNYYVFNDFKEEDLAVGVREGVEEDNNKKNKADFVLWFTKSKFDDQELKWSLRNVGLDYLIMGLIKCCHLLLDIAYYPAHYRGALSVEEFSSGIYDGIHHHLLLNRIHDLGAYTIDYDPSVFAELPCLRQCDELRA